MNHSRDGTMSPASSSRLNFSSATRTFSPSSADSLIGGGSGSGMKAEAASPATVLFSYRPGCRRVDIQGKDPCLVSEESKGSLTKLSHKARFLYEQRTRRGGVREQAELQLRSRGPEVRLLSGGPFSARITAI